MDFNDDAVRVRAYEIWEREGRPDGFEHHHWAQAVSELAAGAGTPSRSGTQAAVDKLKKAATRTIAGAKSKRGRKSVSA